MELYKVYYILISIFFLQVGVYAQQSEFDHSAVVFEDDGSAIIAKIKNKPVFQYNYKTQMPDNTMEYYKRSGFIHPLYSPDGAVITEGFPEKHTHHHGMFSAWVNTKFRNEKIDFWNQQEKTGTVVFKEILEVLSERKYGQLKTKQQHLAFIAGDTIPVLEEIWTLKVYNSTAPFIWDITIEQKNISSSNLQILKYHYGGLAFRGRDEWYREQNTLQTEDTDVDFKVTTNFHQSRLDANHSIPDWALMYGRIGKTAMNLIVIPLSTNPEYPDYLRVHPDFPYFCFTPVVKKGFDLKPSETFKTRYRIITATQTPSEQMIKDIANKKF
ncbi:DUF6807 family protein [Zunongwangia profunda]|jgi:hypothetical protein|uniref:DUF6807 family protein n=1 Tax=Zunongwangia profunda TaxID=398743 RepID=UPI000C94844E|nr:DUF6807 family protein [Zunongwangia profunda]MAG88771.1 hypothetical protein [Flavobacteriaceae bacterium]MCC4229400.1 PmoA family protein [Zunongwangia profunda]